MALISHSWLFEEPTGDLLMTTKPISGSSVRNLPEVTDDGQAPVVYFDLAPTFGNINGVVNVTLAFARHLIDANGQPSQQFVACAHLRCSIASAVDLRNALNDALLMGAPTEGGEN